MPSKKSRDGKLKARRKSFVGGGTKSRVVIAGGVTGPSGEGARGCAVIQVERKRIETLTKGTHTGWKMTKECKPLGPTRAACLAACTILRSF